MNGEKIMDSTHQMVYNGLAMFSADQNKRNIINLNTLEMKKENSDFPQNKALNIGVVMHRFYMQIAKDHNIPTERILLAITDNGKDVQEYSTNLEETEITYLQDYSLPNGA